MKFHVSDRSQPPPVVTIQKNPENARVMRWALALQPFSFPTEHHPGELNIALDFLSRMQKGVEEAETIITNRTFQVWKKTGLHMGWREVCNRTPEVMHDTKREKI